MRTLRERFEAKVGDPNEDGCWPWLGSISTDGYARIRIGGRETEVAYAHRVSYELFVGPIPEGLTIDHVEARGCNLRSCVNPAHLEPVTGTENTRRGRGARVLRTGRCIRGHDQKIHGYRRRDGNWTHCNACRRELRAVA